ncbi:MAG TPA: penicillin acylase family protein, partial [Solirubrobacteraceae bacterium]|nr:penicillin acylase family protein [Solirubrobacteraceae bacterium]
VGIMPHASTLTAADLNVYYKDTDFGSMPGGIGSYESPKAGVEIYFDKEYGMAHIYADNFNAVAWAAGYEQAQERLFLMDVLRRTAEGTLAGLLGASAASGDAQQLTTQDFSPQELTEQADELPQRFGAEGTKALDALNQYVAGINARIEYDKTDPLEMPAEYAALGASPAPWTLADSAAEAVLLESQFTVSGGSQEIASELQQDFQKRFGRHWLEPYDDLSEPEDPAALTIQSKPVHSDNAGKIEPKLDLNAIPNPGSIVPRNDELVGPDATQQDTDRALLPKWASALEHLHASMPTVESNAVLVSPKLSQDGHALAAMGPQVGYYSPQIFTEYELHGGGVDSEGVVFPGADPFPLIGHGIDFAWSGTSANGINQDTFAELLCNPDGSPATDASTHYMYKGHCIPFDIRDQTVTTPIAPTSPSTPETITYQALRSVHGPVFAYAKVGTHPVALTVAKAVDFHELNAIVAFMELSENVPTNAQQFRQVMGQFPGTETWFYVDDKNIAYQESGYYPEHAKHSNPNLPYWGTGKANWVGFNPSTYTEKDLPPSERPGETNPSDGYLISWNNKEAPGWYLGPTEWDGGPIQHALILKQRLMGEIRAGGGKTNLVGLARAVNTTATTDLREFDVYPVMRKVLGHVKGPDAQFVALLNQWYADGSQRLAPAGSNIYGNSAAVSVMDAWWPLAVKAIFEPALGSGLFSDVVNDVLNLPSGPGDEFGGYDWTGATYTDLRDVLLYNTRAAALARAKRRAHLPPAPGSHIVSWDGSYSRIYCGNRSSDGGGATIKACRAVLLSSLTAAIAQVEEKLGSNPATWKVDATCAQTSPASCDQEVPTTAGAIATPPFPWQDRGTYHQIVEVNGHR